MNDTAESSPFLTWLLLGILSLIWGSSYILIKKGLVAFSPEQLASMRISISMLAFLPFFILQYRQIDWSKFKALTTVGAAGSFIPAFLFAFAQTEISSSLAGVLASLTPLFTLLLGIIFYNIKVTWIKVLGVIIGLAGAVFLILFSSKNGVEGNMWYGFLVVLGCGFYAWSVNTVKVHLQEISSLTISAASFTIVGPFGLLYLFTTDFFTVLTTDPNGWTSFGYIILLALGSTVLASLLFYRLVQLTHPVFAASVSYLIPIIAILWGVVDGEPITFIHLIGMVVILLGVYIARR